MMENLNKSELSKTPFEWNFELQEKLKNTKYCGIFVDSEELYQKMPGTLDKVIEHPHVTIKYRPEEQELHGHLIGQNVEIEAIGYGKDEENEGLLVRLKADNDELQKLCDQIPVPHITLSISENGKAVNTSNLQFAELQEPFLINGSYGAFIATDEDTPPEVITSQD